MGLGLAVLGALLVGPQVAAVGVIALCGAALVLVSVVDDRRTLPPGVRLGIELACAAGAVTAGVRVTGTGVAGLDIVVTLLVVVGAANAL